MKIKMVDSVVTIGIKWLEEQKFDTVLQYKLRGGTPNGHIHIWVPQAATFAIDNINIRNLDDAPALIETEFKSGKIEAPADYKWEPTERVYKEAVTKKSGKISWYLLIPTTAVVSAGILLITALATRGKRKKKGEAA